MLTDSHCHPYDVARILPGAEESRRQLCVLAASSACDWHEFAHNEELAKKSTLDNTAPLLPCFAVHPQALSAGCEFEKETEKLLITLDDLATQKRITAVGECGFDLYNDTFRETEKIQDKVFAIHLEIAIKYDLPVVFHVRRAMHKIFAAGKILKKCRAVVFHSWPGTLEEGQALIRRGVNAYFSFGNTLMNGRKQSQQSCALFPAERLLTETDAPYQPQRGESFSQWSDLPIILKTITALRGEAGFNTTAEEMETQIEANFKTAFLIRGCL